MIAGKICFLDEIPDSGQFVSIWCHNGQMWSATMRWIDGVLFEFIPEGDDNSEHFVTVPEFQLQEMRNKLHAKYISWEGK